jgi:CrcB protein
MHFLLVALGGAIGAAARHGVNLAGMRLLGIGFPWGTVAVNVVGALVMGIFIEMLARRWGGSAELRLFVATGILGGFTTFSAFSLDAVTLYQRGEIVLAFIYVAGSVILSIAALFLGLWLARTVA